MVEKKQPKISLIIPVYNTPEYILRLCLNSVKRAIGHNDEDIEVIIIDDGSGDWTRRIYQYYDNFRVELIEHSGVSKARNRGLEIAKGEYITFLDSDDEIKINAFDIIFKTLAEHKDDNIIQFNQFRHYKRIDTTKIRYENQEGRYWFHNKPQLWCLVWNKIYRKAILDAYNIRFVEGLNFGEDEIFNLECLMQSKSLWHDKHAYVIKHFDNENSICHNLTIKEAQGLIEALQDLYTKFKGRKDSQGAYEVECLIFEHLHSELYERIYDAGK